MAENLNRASESPLPAPVRPATTLPGGGQTLKGGWFLPDTSAGEIGYPTAIEGGGDTFVVPILRRKRYGRIHASPGRTRSIDREAGITSEIWVSSICLTQNPAQLTGCLPGSHSVHARERTERSQ